MDNVAKLEIYKAQVVNTRSLHTAMRQVHRSINRALRSNDYAGIEAFTKIYALLFCSWAEANFSKIIHTPHALELDEIAQVKAVKDKKGIAPAWQKCVELGLRHLDAKRGSFKPNTQQKLYEFIELHVFDPALLRNKLAHGQWSVALNRENDAVRTDATAEIAALDVVRISAWVTGHTLLAALVESLSESPKKEFMRDWYGVVAALEEQMAEASARRIEDHVAKLLAKDERTGARFKRRSPDGEVAS